MRKKILFIVQLPPPVHGSSVASCMIRQDVMINEEFDCRYINLSASVRVDEVSDYRAGRVMFKLLRFAGSLFKTIYALLTFRPEVCYITITCHGIPFIRDSIFVLLCKLVGCRIILHQHNKGMSRYVNKPLYRSLFQVVYRNTTVILLSWCLYDDIADIVKREQIMICPNGV
ncbi:MAG: hypothetical protein IJN29_14615 [Akkermansia sp.]|nr:hypothetical protein [Akkermansia sp.]